MTDKQAAHQYRLEQAEQMLHGGLVVTDPDTQREYRVHVIPVDAYQAQNYLPGHSKEACDVDGCPCYVVKEPVLKPVLKQYRSAAELAADEASARAKQAYVDNALTHALAETKVPDGAPPREPWGATRRLP